MPLNSMPQLPAQQLKTSWWQTLVNKTQRVFLALRTPANLPINVIQLSDGLLIDLQSNRLVVLGELSLHTTGTMRLTSDEHVIIASGCGTDERGEIQGVWLNPELDESGQPYEIPDEIEIEVLNDQRA
jgi:hypothetical protein